MRIRSRGPLRAVLFVFATAALVGATAAFAAPPFAVGGGQPDFAGGPPPGVGGGMPDFLTNDRVVGSGTWTDFSSPVAGEVDASADPAGANPSGTVVVTATFNVGVRTLHGDVSQGCVVVDGNLALVVGRIPVAEQWFTVGFGTVEYAGVVVEDNGRGSPSADRVIGRALRETSKQAACAAGPAWFISQTWQPLESGDFAVADR